MTDNAPAFQPAGASYSPGGWVALAANQQWLLVQSAAFSERVQECWAAMSAGGSVSDVLSPLFADGLDQVPDFALFALVGGGSRVVLRGAGALRYGSVSIGAEATILVDRVLTDIPADAAVVLSAGETADASLQLPLAAGVTMASSIRLVATAAALAVPVAAAAFAEPVAAPATASIPAPAAIPAPAPTPMIMKESAPSDGNLHDHEQPEPDESAGEFDHLFAATVHPDQLRQLRDELASDPTVSLAKPEPAEPIAAPPVVAAETAPDAVPVAPIPASALAPTVYHTQQWATRPPFEDAGLIDSVPWLTGATENPSTPAAETPPLPVASAPPVQASTPEPPTAPPSNQNPQQQTVKRSSLAAMVSAGPMVMAAFCPSGHANPPHAAQCRNCGLPIVEQEPKEIARPVLGQLRLSTGEGLSLDRGVLIGREPTDPTPAGGERPHVLRLPDDLQVSRNHVEVSIDGWRVYVADLGSTNGTFVTPVRQPTMRLNERDPQLIEPGTEVRLSDDFSFVYEVS